MALQLRRATFASWTAVNPLLAQGELGVETDTGRFKVGDGVLLYNALPYSSGPPGAVGISFVEGPQGEPGDAVVGASSSSITRMALAPEAKNWVFLGTATGNTVTVGPVVWTGQYRQLKIDYIITGYNGGTPVGRLLFGVGSISTTALTNGSKLSEDVTAPTNAPSIPGVPLAVTLSNIARQGFCYVDGASGSLKSYNIVGQNGTPAVGTPPTLYRASGVFSDLGTNLLLQRAQLTVYDTLVATAASAQTFTSGTYLAVWGRNTD